MEEVKLILADNGGFIVKYHEYIKSGESEYESRIVKCREEIFSEKDLNAAISRMKELTNKDED